MAAVERDAGLRAQGDLRGGARHQERKRSEEERERLVEQLQSALAELKVLQKILPICMYCRKVRDDVNFWDNVETYIARRTETRFSHGICPPCYERVMGGADDDTH